MKGHLHIISPVRKYISNQVELGSMERNSSNWRNENNDDSHSVEVSWERWGNFLVNVLPYVTLIIALIIAWLTPGSNWQENLINTLLAGLASAWVYFMYTRVSSRLHASPPWMVIYYAGLLLVAAVLMYRQPIFFLFALTGFFHSIELRPWPLMFLMVGLTSILLNTLLTGFPWPERETWVFFAMLIIIQTFAIGFGNMLAEKLTNINKQRKQAITRLEAALEENEGLQAQLVAQAREAGILEERQRLAREIHDTLAQGLIGIITQLRAAQQAKNSPENWQRHLENALELAQTNLMEARRSVHALAPAPLESAHLPQALAEVAQHWSSIHGVKVEVITTGDPTPLPPDIETALLRTAQEALSNIARHAYASRVGITLSFMGNMVALDIRDDGVGFQMPEQVVNASEGFGLASMRQRIHQVAGILEIETDPGSGTAISARVPILSATQEIVE